MHIPHLLTDIYHATSPSHRRAARQRKAEYARDFSAHQEENLARVRRMSQLRGEPSQDFLYDSAWGTGAAVRSRSRPTSMIIPPANDGVFAWFDAAPSVPPVPSTIPPPRDVQPAYDTAPRRRGGAAAARPVSVLVDGDGAWMPGMLGAGPPQARRRESGYESGMSGYSGSSSGASAAAPPRNSVEAAGEQRTRRPGSIAPSLMETPGSGVEQGADLSFMSGGLDGGSFGGGGGVPVPAPTPSPRYVDVATPVTVSKAKARPVSLGGASAIGEWVGRRRSRSRGANATVGAAAAAGGKRKPSRIEGWWEANRPKIGAAEDLVAGAVRVEERGGRREFRMSAMVG